MPSYPMERVIDEPSNPLSPVPTPRKSMGLVFMSVVGHDMIHNQDIERSIGIIRDIRDNSPDEKLKFEAAKFFFALADKMCDVASTVKGMEERQLTSRERPDDQINQLFDAIKHHVSDSADLVRKRYEIKAGPSEDTPSTEATTT